MPKMPDLMGSGDMRTGTLIILQAFGGRLKSEPMEWPEAGVRDVILPVSQHMYMQGPFSLGKDFDPSAMTVRKARFIPTGQHEILRNGNTAEIYEMVDY